jgi:hypothetical protein
MREEIMMIQEPYGQANADDSLANRLYRLSFREQLNILLRATRHLPHRNRAAILGSAGLSLLRTRFLPMLIHFLFKRFVKGVLWSVMSVVIAVLCLLLLAFLEQVSPKAVTPVIVVVVISFLAYIISTIIDVVKDIHQLVAKTCSKVERSQLLQMVNNLNQAEKIIALRELGTELSKRGAGEPIITPFLTEFALLIAIGLSIGFVVLISQFAISALILFIIAAILALLSGFLVPHLIRESLLSRRDKATMPVRESRQA